MAYEIGKTIIDELKLCYEADMTVLEDLASVNYGESYDSGNLYSKSNDPANFSFYRTTSHHFKYAYDVCIGGINERKKVATARFGRYGDVEVSDYFFYRVENYVLYDFDLLQYTLTIPEMLGMCFHNFTSLDIAIDARTDIARLMRRMWHREDVTTIINRKAIKDRKAIVKHLNLTYSTSLERLKNLTVYVKQSKASHDKTKGVTVQAYNKGNEISEASHKDYIREFYGNPKRLYRLEVHLNNAEIKDYCKRLDVSQDLNMIYDQTFLTDMFYYHLSSVIRFTKGREKLDWKDIIKNNGRL